MSTRPGVTLIEMLAVIAILGAALTLMLGIVAPLRGAHSAVHIEGTVASAVARARIIAQADGGAALHITSDAIRIESDSRTARIPIGADWSAAILTRTATMPVDAIEFDGAGRSIDYEVQVSDRSSATRTLVVLGLSGQVLANTEVESQ